jgi:hypothetical protein
MRLQEKVREVNRIIASLGTELLIGKACNEDGSLNMRINLDGKVLIGSIFLPSVVDVSNMQRISYCASILGATSIGFRSFPGEAGTYIDFHYTASEAELLQNKIQQLREESRAIYSEICDLEAELSTLKNTGNADLS